MIYLRVHASSLLTGSANACLRSTPDGVQCPDDTDCPAPAAVENNPMCDYTLGCPAAYMGAHDGCDW